ncbi:MAG: pyridoxal phosphate-dependent aminotransferase [Lachnospiraceae bacterium]|nr:pyridoxal phosphate-dependent aminotransferase [Lachnospiraceae bacterium]
MLVQKYKDMLSGKSVIRQLSEFATARGQEIGYENVFDYSLGNPSVPVPREFTDRMIHMLATKETSELHGYSPSLGITSVREAIAASLEQRFGLPYKKEHIFMASGAAGALAHAFRLVTEPGDEILTFAPYFPEYNPYVNLTGAVLKIVPPNTENFQINFEAFEEMLTEKVMAILINTPNNPSGVVYSTETLQKLADILKEKSEKYGHTIYLISDEPYREIVFEGVEAPCVSSFYDNTIMCYSFSKSLSLPGERIGYVAINPACADAETMVNMCGQISRGIGHNCPPSIIQLAVAQVLDKTADLKVYETNMNLLYNELTDLGFTCVKPGGTFYIFPKALEEDAKEFCQKALKYDLVLVPGDSFGAPGYFRMAYCIDTEKVERSLAALRKFVTEVYGSKENADAETVSDSEEK